MVDVRPDGVVRSHFFRRVYDVIAEDIDRFEKPVETPGIRKEDLAIANLERRIAYTEEGELELGKTKKISSFLNENYLRFPGNETHIVIGQQIFAITDTTMSSDGKEVTMSLRNIDNGSTSTQTFETKKKAQFPTYADFQRIGISRAGSNIEMAANILDGDPTTYWEPDLQEDNDKWWVEVDLGRVLVVEKIVLHFVDQELGDPFRQFRVLITPEQKLIQGQSRVLNFAVVGLTNAPNTDERTVEFSAETNPNFALGDEETDWTGRLGQTIRIQISESKLGRGRQVSEEQWQALSPAERGDILYYIRDQTGFEEPVSEEIFLSLPAQQQGGKDFFVRERPRLSRIEVWGWGDNLSHNLLEGGGSIDFDGPERPIAGFDANWATSFRMPGWFSNNPTAAVMTVDLGALVRLDAMRIGASRDFPGYVLEGADGSRDAAGKLRWRRLSPVEREGGGYRLAAENFEPAVSVRFLNLRLPGVTRTSGFFYSLNDIMLFTEGYVAAAPLVSDIIRLPGPRNLGAIRWDPGPDAAPEGTEVEIRTRTGDLLVEQIRHFDTNGLEKTKTEWEKLITSFKGPVDTSFVIGGGWSNWSQKYLRPGDQVTSPGLRNFMQVQVNFTSDNRFETAEIRSFEIDLVSPAAFNLIGEIWPQQSLPGKLDTFEVFVRPTFIDAPVTSTTPGFDEVLLKGADGGNLELLGLSLGTEEEFSSSQPRSIFSRSADGTFLNDNGDVLKVSGQGEDSLWVQLPAMVTSLSAAEQARTYNRITPQDGEVVVSQSGDLLTEAAYGLLTEDERGSILYFKQTLDNNGNPILEEVAGRGEYEVLEPEQRGPVRYFRKQLGGGSQVPFDAAGNALEQGTYNALPASERGFVLGQGTLVRLRFATTVFLNGTTMKVFVLNSSLDGDDEDPLWQQVEAGNATDLTASQDLSIRVPFSGNVLDNVELPTNPFTPNGDGINDELKISFSVLKVSQERNVWLRIYGLDGRLIWDRQQVAQSGAHTFRWTGTDHSGNTVPPGLYICQIHLDVDSDKVDGNTISRLVAVVY
jgi:hypothetical protein